MKIGTLQQDRIPEPSRSRRYIPTGVNTSAKSFLQVVLKLYLFHNRNDPLSVLTF
jgi:hypothetical protein